MTACAPQLGQKVSAYRRPQRHVDRVFIHCSASGNPRTSASEVDRWHREERGWACIGYHFFICSDGMVQFGRDASLTPAAQAGHNSGTVAICVNGLTDLDFTSDQFNALRRLCREIDTAHGGKVTFHGHCEVSSKSCPVFDYKQVLKLSRDGHLPAEGAPQEAQGVVSAPAKAIGVPETAASTTEIVVRRVTVSLEARPTHPDVKRLQRMLSAFSPVSPGECDGVFGEKTRASLIAFQEVAGLIPDGVAGPVTWETLERYK